MPLSHPLNFISNKTATREILWYKTYRQLPGQSMETIELQVIKANPNDNEFDSSKTHYDSHHHSLQPRNFEKL